MLASSSLLDNKMMKMTSALLALLACSCAAQVSAAGFPTDWPTKIKTDAGYELGVEGLFQYDVNHFSGAGINPITHRPVFNDAQSWRRQELDAYIRAPNGLEADVGYDWQASWTDNYLKYRSATAGDFRLGQFKTQVGWTSNESASAGTFMERPLPDQVVYEGRRLGVDWSYDKIPHWLISAAYLAGGDMDGQHDGHSYSGRVIYSPIDTQTSVVHLGLAGSREMPDDHIARFSSAPEAGLTQTDLVDTGKLRSTRSIDRTGLEMGLLRGPLFAQGEYLRVAAHRTYGKPDFSGRGYYLFGAWMLTGESRGYKDSFFVNAKPAHSYGAVELALRYSEISLHGGAVQGGRQHDWTLGLNWYVGRHMKLQVNYVWARATGSPVNAYLKPIGPRVFEARAQLYF